MSQPDFYVYQETVKRPNPDYHLDYNYMLIDVTEITFVPTNLQAINWAADTARRLGIYSSKNMVIETNDTDAPGDLRSMLEILNALGYSYEIMDDDNKDNNVTGVTDFQWRLAKQNMLLSL